MREGRHGPPPLENSRAYDEGYREHPLEHDKEPTGLSRSPKLTTMMGWRNGYPLSSLRWQRTPASHISGYHSELTQVCSQFVRCRLTRNPAKASGLFFRGHEKYPVVAKSRYHWWPDKNMHPVFVAAVKNCGPQ
jgi:hypothetical protein